VESDEQGDGCGSKIKKRNGIESKKIFTLLRKKEVWSASQIERVEVRREASFLVEGRGTL